MENTIKKEKVVILKKTITDFPYGSKTIIKKGTVILEGLPITGKLNIKWPIIAKVHGHGVYTYAYESQCEIKIKSTEKIVHYE